MSSPNFEGWVAHDVSSVDGNMKWESYTPKPFEENDIEMEVSHCGVCGSDLHHLRSGWRPAIFPMVVGHEIVGRVTRVGDNVKDIKIGDRVGVGAKCKSCQQPDCRKCSANQEQHCRVDAASTYDAKFPDGNIAFGGYAKFWRGPSDFIVPIPESLPSEVAAPLLCGGITVYSPLKDNGAGPGKRVGIIGIGGLGHFAVIFAKAMKCDKVVAISRTSSKKQDALDMGADEYIATEEDPDWLKNHAESLDLIISTVSGPGLDVPGFLSLLDINGTMVQVGAPDDKIPAFSVFALLRNNVKLGGSSIGSRKTAVEMLEFVDKEKLKFWTETRPMSDANQVLLDLTAGKCRYRYVLAN